MKVLTAAVLAALAVSGCALREAKARRYREERVPVYKAAGFSEAQAQLLVDREIEQADLRYGLMRARWESDGRRPGRRDWRYPR
jgi:hypothetical protein